jgi:hypothetical protein
LKKLSENVEQQKKVNIEESFEYPPFPLPMPFPTPCGYRTMVDSVIEAACFPSCSFIWDAYEGLDDDDLERRNAKYLDKIKMSKLHVPASSKVPVSFIFGFIFFRLQTM